MKNYIKHSIISKSLIFEKFMDKSDTNNFTNNFKPYAADEKTFAIIERYYSAILKSQLKLKEINNHRFFATESALTFLDTVYLTSYMPSSFLSFLVGEKEQNLLNNIKLSLGSFYAQRFFTFNTIVGNDFFLSYTKEDFTNTNDFFDVDFANSRREETYGTFTALQTTDTFSSIPWMHDYFFMLKLAPHYIKTKKNSLFGSSALNFNYLSAKDTILFITKFDYILFNFNQFFRNHFSFYKYLTYKILIRFITFYLPIFFFVIFSYIGSDLFPVLFKKWYIIFNNSHFPPGYVPGKNISSPSSGLFYAVDIAENNFIALKSKLNIFVLGVLRDLDEVAIEIVIVLKRLYWYMSHFNTPDFIYGIKTAGWIIAFRIKYLVWAFFAILYKLGRKYKYWEIKREWKMTRYTAERADRRFRVWNENHSFNEVLTFKWFFGIPYHPLQVLIIFGAFFYILYEVYIFVKTIYYDLDPNTGLPYELPRGNSLDDVPSESYTLSGEKYEEPEQRRSKHKTSGID